MADYLVLDKIALLKATKATELYLPTQYEPVATIEYQNIAYIVEKIKDNPIYRVAYSVTGCFGSGKPQRHTEQMLTEEEYERDWKELCFGPTIPAAPTSEPSMAEYIRDLPTIPTPPSRAAYLATSAFHNGKALLRENE